MYAIPQRKHLNNNKGRRGSTETERDREVVVGYKVVG